MGGKCVLVGPNLEKCGKFWKNGRFSGRIWPDWGGEWGTSQRNDIRNTVHEGTILP